MTLVSNRAANSGTLISRTWVTTALVFGVVGLCYAAGAELAWGIFGAGTIGLAFFPPAGVTLAAMVLLPRRSWPVVVAAIVLAEITVDLRHGLSFGTAMGWALANSVEPFVGASLFRGLQRSSKPMSHRLGLLRFSLAGVIGGPLVASVIAGTVRAGTSNTSWFSAALHFWVGDGLGVLAIAAPILACWETRPWKVNRDLFEAVGFQILVLTVSVLAFWVWEAPPTFLVLPVLVVGAVRYATPGVTVASAVMAVVANTATAAGRGPFLQFDTSPQNQLAFVQLFMASVMVTVWYLAVETADRATSSAAQTYERAARERAEATRAIGDLSENLLSPVSVSDIAAVVRSQLCPRFDLSLCAITLLNRETERFDPQNTGLSCQVFQSITNWTPQAVLPGPMAVATGQPVWAGSQADLLKRFPDLSDLAAIENLHALGALPLRGSDLLLGYLGVARSEDRPFSSAEQDDLLAIALVVSQAVQRAEIYEAERKTHLALEVAKERVDTLLVQSGVEAERLRESENRFRAIADGSPLLIWIVDEAGRFTWANASVCEYFGLSIEQFVPEGFEHLFHPEDAAAFSEVFQASLAAGESFKGEWRVRAGEQWRWVEMWGRPRLDPAGVFCGYIGNSVDMTDRHHGEEILRSIAALQQLRLQVEHEAVLTLQHALLPDTIRWNPSVIVHARYHAASNGLEVGGDWYDTFVWPTGHLGLMVGDVVGHSITSAAAMGRLRAAASALAGAVAPSPAVILDALDRFAHGPDGTDYATAVCVIIDPKTGRLTYSSAGHPPVVVVSPDGTTTSLCQAQSAPLGVGLARSRGERSIDLEPGALVMLYSDGLIERRGEPLDVGITRLEQSIVRNRDMPVGELADLIVANLTADTQPVDDIVIACFRYTPVVAQLNLQLNARAVELAGMRDAIRIWLGNRQVDPDGCEDVLLVVGEACANTIDHAYRHQNVGTISIELTDHSHHIAVRVVDQGNWRPPGRHNVDRGRGTLIMQALTDCFDVKHDASGTVVNCTIKLTAPRVSQLVSQP